MKRALITGITGQDGSFLAEHLLEQGYEVHGAIRRIAMEDPNHLLWRIRHLTDRVSLHCVALNDYASLFRLFTEIPFDECYHLASHSYVTYSFEDDFDAYSPNITGTNHLLTAIRDIRPACRLYFAGSSEMFGNAQTTPQNESTPFAPRSFYGISKVAGYHVTRNYRENAGLFACTGILYNHESERRGFEFVTRKISNAVAGIKLGLARELRLGNLANRRDWGYAADYVRAMRAMLQHDEPTDFVVATGETHTVQEFVEHAFDFVGLDWKDYVVIDEKLCRPAEAVELRGDCAKARTLLGWEPAVRFHRLVETMVGHDLQRLKGQS